MLQQTESCLIVNLVMRLKLYIAVVLVPFLKKNLSQFSKYVLQLHFEFTLKNT